MKNCTTTPSKLMIGGFDRKDDTGKLIAIVGIESDAKKFSMLPEMIEWLQERVENCSRNKFNASLAEMETTAITCEAMRFAYQSVLDKINEK